MKVTVESKSLNVQGTNVWTSRYGQDTALHQVHQRLRTETNRTELTTELYLTTLNDDIGKF